MLGVFAVFWCPLRDSCFLSVMEFGQGLSQCIQVHLVNSTLFCAAEPVCTDRDLTMHSGAISKRHSVGREGFKPVFYYVSFEIHRPYIHICYFTTAFVIFRW